MFCLKYYPFKTKEYFKDVDEIRITYRPTDQSLKDFLEIYKDKSIVIDIIDSFDDVDEKLFQGLFEKYSNIKLIIDYHNKEILEKVQANNFPFFFVNAVTTIDQLMGLLKYNPTDMYICEELGFFLDKVSKILHDNNIKVRVYPNICQSSFSETPSLQTFFIRPEDIPIYNLFVDVFELIDDEERQEVIFKVYKEEKWFGPINEIIPSFNNDLDSKYLLDSFGIIRAKCGKRCMYKPGSCNICTHLTGISEILKKNNIFLMREEKKN